LAHLVRRSRKNLKTGKIQDYWMIVRRVGKKERANSIGFMTQKKAEAALALYEADLEAGRDPFKPDKDSLPGLTQTIPTLSEWWGDIREPWPAWPPCRMLVWLDARGAAAKTRRAYDDSRRMIVQMLGNIRINAFSTADADAFVSSLRQQNYSARTIQIRVDHLKRSLQIAQEDGLITSIPRIQRPATEKADAVFHTPDQTQRLLEALQQRVAASRRGGLSYLAVLPAVTCGMRPGEVCTRRWSDLDWKAGTLKISPVKLPNGTIWKPKAGSGRTLPLPPQLLAVFQVYWETNGQPIDTWLFPNRDDPRFPMTSYKKALAGACKAANLPVLHPHALRHTAATRWVWDGVDIPTMMKLGGWKTPVVPLGVYAQTNQEHMAEALFRSAPVPPADQAPLTSRADLVSGAKKKRGST
jgi:integrase